MTGAWIQRLVMRRRLLWTAVVLSAPLAHAASQFQFDVWMRDVDHLSVSVQRAIAARDLKAAKADAQELERLYALMAQYFVHDYPAADGEQMSQDGRALASSIPAALDRQAFDEAALAARDIARACNDCHDPYKPLPPK
jgi:hypothetical protein